MKKSATFLCAAVYNLIVVSALFVAFEIAVRWFVPQVLPQGTDQVLCLDNAVGTTYGLRPFSSGFSNGARVEVDGFGCRRCSVPLDPGKPGWLLLGDSITFGIGVEADSTFAGILQARFDSINVLNPSMIGYNVRDYLNVCTHFLDRPPEQIRITRVILCWCLNDHNTDSQTVDMPGARWRKALGGLLRTVRMHARFYHFLKARLFDRPRAYYAYDSRPYVAGNRAFEDAVERIREIRACCMAHGASLSVVLIPFEFQVREGTPETAIPQRLLGERLAPLGLPVYDPLPELLRAGGDSRRFYLYGDGLHLSAYGHRRIGDGLVSWLARPHSRFPAGQVLPANP
jgi:hypothetical protein